MFYVEHTVEEAYIPRRWFDDVMSDLEARQSYWDMIDQIQEDWNAQLEESLLFQDWRQEFDVCA